MARLNARYLVEQALGHYSRVTYDYEATELQARLVPEGETHGARVMARLPLVPQRVRQPDPDVAGPR